MGMLAPNVSSGTWMPKCFFNVPARTNPPPYPNRPDSSSDGGLLSGPRVLCGPPGGSDCGLFLCLPRFVLRGCLRFLGGPLPAVLHGMYTTWDMSQELCGLHGTCKCNFAASTRQSPMTSAAPIHCTCGALLHVQRRPRLHLW